MSAPFPLRDPWFRLAIGSLWFCGSMYVALGALACGYAVYTSFQVQSHVVSHAGPSILQSVASAAILLVGVLVGTANFVVAWGLRRHAKWAWIGALVIAAVYGPSGCLPFGAVIAYALLRAEVREAYLNQSQS